jgi:hypothetical protein
MDESHAKNNDPPDGELTVLDWVKSIIRGRVIPIPGETSDRDDAIQTPEEDLPRGPIHTPRPRSILLTPAQIRFPAAIFLGLLAQYVLENFRDDPKLAIAFYVIAGLLIFWAVWRGDYKLEPVAVLSPAFPTIRFRPTYLILGIAASALTFIAARNNLFDLPTTFFWIVSVIAFVLAFWEGDLVSRDALRGLQAKLIKPQWKVQISRWSLLLIAVLGVVVFFRFYQLDHVPPEMVSDHAEKLLDVLDVMNGLPSIFFPRNTGREALQFYMAAVTVRLFDTGISHLTLKIGTAFAGVVTVVYMYLIGKELGNRRIGLFALFLAGVAYWPNVISRVGLRFPLYPLFVAPVFYHLIKGVQQRSRNDFILCGLFLGAGLHGYSPSRVIPIIVVLGIMLLLLHKEARENRVVLLTLLFLTGLVAIVVTMPLIRVAIDRPDDVIYRMATRFGSTERPLPGPALQIFLSNVWNGLKMFGWDNGEVWVNSIPHRPALDWVTSTFFHLGLVMLLVRYLKQRRWVDLFLILSIPLLQLPSTLSLAFPAENPATNRAAGAIVPVFLIAAYAFDALPRWFREQWQEARWERYGLVLVSILFILVARINYNLVFVEYQDLFRRSAWNTSEAGEVIHHYANSIGSYESAYVVAFPHWVDTRLVAMNAGIPTRDYAISPENLGSLLEKPGPYLLLLHPDDEVGLNTLYDLFPNLSVNRWPNEIPGKDFVIAFVPVVEQLEQGLDQ